MDKKQMMEKKPLLKKLVAMGICGSMLFSLIACGNNETAAEGTDSAAGSAQEQPVAQEQETASTEEVTTTGDDWAPVFSAGAGGDSSKSLYEAELAIVQNGELLFSGSMDEGYYPSESNWLTNAAAGDAIAIAFACDVADHGGWGVLGLGATVSGSGYKQIDIVASGEKPEQERIELYRMEEIAALLGASNHSELSGFCLGAWNGGRIAGLYLISEQVADELEAYMDAADPSNSIVHTYDGTLSNENATEEAQLVYSYLCNTYGEYCLTGQMESTWKGSPDYEMNYIEENTGRLPAIRGLDFMNNDFAGVVSRSQSWWEKGGIVTICWHTGADFSSGYTECLADDINWDDAFTPGTETFNALVAGMDRAVPYLQELEDAGVPVLWRPFHELDGGWFWWSKGGSENFVKLWQMMYQRYTDYWGLDNLIWVYGYSHNGQNIGNWYPGDEYVDLIGGDSYDPGANPDLYQEVDKVQAEGMPIVFHECGTIPTEEEMKEAQTPWLYFMVWHTDYLTDESNNTKESLKEIYNSDYFITLDELDFAQ